MKKLRLEIEDLRVDSFATATPKDAQGTVHGNEISKYPTYCYGALCPPAATRTNCPGECY